MTEHEAKDNPIQRLAAAAADLREAMGIGNDTEHEAALDLLSATEEYLAERERVREEIRNDLIKLRDDMAESLERLKAEYAEVAPFHVEPDEEHIEFPSDMFGTPPEPWRQPEGGGEPPSVYVNLPDDREHTATTRHLVDVTVTVPGDDGVDPKYLVDVLMWGLEQHNHKVSRFGQDDHAIEPVAMAASGDIGLGGERAAFCHDPEGSDFTYFGVEGATLRRCDDSNNDEPLADEDILLQF